jgi:hypothetical protein
LKTCKYSKSCRFYWVFRKFDNPYCMDCLRNRKVAKRRIDNYMANKNEQETKGKE